MSRIAISQAMLHVIEHAIEERAELPYRREVTQHSIQPVAQFCRRQPLPHQRLQRCMQARHQQSRRHPLARHIRDAKYCFSLAGAHHVVVIPTHKFQRLRHGRDVVPGKFRQSLRKQLVLNRARVPQFFIVHSSRPPLLACQGNLALQFLQQFAVLPWLLNKIRSPTPHGFHRQVDAAPCRHHNHRKQAIGGPDL